MLEENIEKIAIICHEANRNYCLHVMEDLSQDHWYQAHEWQRESAIAGVKFHLSNPDATDAASHECWLAGKEKDGWVYGPEKDVERKTHPCMVPFSDLPKGQQLKDRLFRSIVDALREIP